VCVTYTIGKSGLPTNSTANDDHAGENHYSQPDGADQTGNAENLR
jgi:hypothetical protein